MSKSSVPGRVAHIQVERAIAEMRASRPVLLRAGRSLAVVLSVEALDADLAQWLEPLARRPSCLVLPAPRLRRLGLERSAPGAIALPRLDLGRIEYLALQLGARFDAPVAALSRRHRDALELARLALVLPAVIITAVSAKSVANAGLIEVDGGVIASYRAAEAADIHIVSRAPVPLEGAETEFVIFRGGEGLRDQVAVVIGKPNFAEPVNVRLHSACLTGDLFGSLKCDCGDQLRHAARFMAENGGGVLLYLDQEGRGNGLANKIRAYRLQTQGFDTYDADEILGFDHDQRRFGFAAAMLRQLGVRSVRVMTNNPLKIDALRAAGIEVESDQRILGRKNAHNVRYLATKRDRAGHMIDVEALAGPAAPKE
jgi:GTP cyclohydrolase II